MAVILDGKDLVHHRTVLTITADMLFSPGKRAGRFSKAEELGARFLSALHTLAGDPSASTGTKTKHITIFLLNPLDLPLPVFAHKMTTQALDSELNLGLDVACHDFVISGLVVAPQNSAHRLLKFLFSEMFCDVRKERPGPIHVHIMHNLPFKPCVFRDAFRLFQIST